MNHLHSGNELYCVMMMRWSTLKSKAPLNQQRRRTNGMQGGATMGLNSSNL